MRKALTYSNLHIVLDMVKITILIHFTADRKSFYLLLRFSCHCSQYFPALPTTYTLASLAMALVLLVVGLEYAGWIPHYNLQGFANPDLYRKASYVLPVLVAFQLFFMAPPT